MYLCFFTIADLSIYLYLTYCKPWQSINMNVVPPLLWEMSSMNSKFMIVCIYTWKPIYMCRRWIPRGNLRLPIQILRHPMPHDFCKLQSFLKSSKSVQELLSSSQETFYCRDLKNDIVSWICQDGLVSGHLCLSCWKSASFERSLASSICKQIWKKSKLAVIVNL